MQTKIPQVLISGILATIAMAILTLMAGALDIPKMSSAEMISGMMGVSITIGWVLQFVIGIIFAAGYVFIFNDLLKKITSTVLRGIVYGMIAFVIAQLAIPLMGFVFSSPELPAPKGSKTMLMLGSLFGHVLFGLVVAVLVNPDADLKEESEN